MSRETREEMDRAFELALQDMQRLPEILAEKRRKYFERQLFVDQVFGRVYDQIFLTEPRRKKKS